MAKVLKIDKSIASCHCPPKKKMRHALPFFSPMQHDAGDPDSRGGTSFPTHYLTQPCTHNRERVPFNHENITIHHTYSKRMVMKKNIKLILKATAFFSHDGDICVPGALTRFPGV